MISMSYVHAESSTVLFRDVENYPNILAPFFFTRPEDATNQIGASIEFFETVTMDQEDMFIPNGMTLRENIYCGLYEIYIYEKSKDNP